MYFSIINAALHETHTVALLKAEYASAKEFDQNSFRKLFPQFFRFLLNVDNFGTKNQIFWKLALKYKSNIFGAKIQIQYFLE